MAKENYIQDYVPKPVPKDDNLYYVNPAIVEDFWNIFSKLIPSNEQVHQVFEAVVMMYYLGIFFESMTLKALGLPRSISRMLVPWPGYNYATLEVAREMARRGL